MKVTPSCLTLCDLMDYTVHGILQARGGKRGSKFLSFTLTHRFRYFTCASKVMLVVNNPPANAGDIRNVGSIPALERSLEGRHGNPLQYSCLKNPMDRGVWKGTVHTVAELDMTKAT